MGKRLNQVSSIKSSSYLWGGQFKMILGIIKGFFFKNVDNIGFRWLFMVAKVSF